MRKQQDNYLVRNPHGVVVIVGESELEGIKRQQGFTVLEKIMSTSTAIEVPKVSEDKKPKYVCNICGHESPTSMNLAQHRKSKHNEEWLKDRAAKEAKHEQTS